MDLIRAEKENLNKFKDIMRLNLMTKPPQGE